MIWDLEFKIFKTLEIREDVRKEYDNAKSRLALLDSQLEEQEKNKTLKDEELATIKDHKEICERDLSRYEAQMKQVDLEIYGSKPTEEYPDGVVGIQHQLDSLYELKVMVKKYEV